MFKENLLLIKKDCKKYHRNKTDLIYNYVNERLSLSLKNYYKELTQSCSYINNRSDNTLIKKYRKGI